MLALLEILKNIIRLKMRANLDSLLFMIVPFLINFILYKCQISLHETDKHIKHLTENHWSIYMSMKLLLLLSLLLLLFHNKMKKGFLKSYLQIHYLRPKIHKIITGKIQRNLE